MSYATIQIAARLARAYPGALASRAAVSRALLAEQLPRKLAATVFEALNTLALKRRKKFEARRQSVAGRSPTGRAPVVLPKGTPAERLHRHRRALAELAIRRWVTIGANDTFRVELTDDPAAVGVRQVETTIWPYKGKFRSWSAKSRDWTVTVPRAYRARVLARDLDEVDGLATLDASPMDGAPQGVELYAAVWIQQGRGHAAHTVRGFLARDPAARKAYHADTAEAALAGLKRKVRVATWAAALAKAKLADLARGHEPLLVCLADARAVGACDYGTRAWAAAVGLDYSAGQATLGEIVAGYAIRPAPEARAVILRVLRRARALTPERVAA